MEDTATPETGPVDAPASIESIVAELEAGGGESPADNLEEVTQELVNEAEGTAGDSVQEPGTEDDATDSAKDEALPEDGTPEEQAEEPTFKVMANGEEITVTQTELLKGYSRLEDYKAKTAAVAEEKRQVEALKANVEAQTKAEYANQLEEATNLFAQFDPVLSSLQSTNWEALKSENPAAFVAAQDAVNERLTAIQQMNQRVAQMRAEAQQHQQAQLEREREQRFQKVGEVISSERPELADPEKLKAFVGDTANFLREAGFTHEEIIDSYDHRVAKLADEARQWRAHLKAQASLPQKKVVTKSAVKPLTSDGSGSSQPRPRFPARADRHAKGDWIADQIIADL